MNQRNRTEPNKTNATQETVQKWPSSREQHPKGSPVVVARRFAFLQFPTCSWLLVVAGGRPPPSHSNLYNTLTIWLALCCSFSLHIGRCYAITFTALSQKKPSRRIVAFCSLHLFRALQFVYVSSSSLSYRMLLLVVVAVTRFEFVWICWKNSSSRKKCSSSLVIGLYDDFADIFLSWLIY